MSSEKVGLPLLQSIEIASPCHANWDEMQGTETKRYCQDCRLHVYDISTMTEQEAEVFLRANLENTGRTCVRLFRRTDGRVLTSDCPVGLRRIRFQLVKSGAAVLAFLFGGLAMAAGGTRLGKWAEQRQNVNVILGRSAWANQSALLGSVCLPPSLITGVSTSNQSISDSMVVDPEVLDRIKALPDRVPLEEPTLDESPQGQKHQTGVDD